MTRQPWAITREMFLSAHEVERLIRHVRDHVEASSGVSSVAAWLDRYIIEALLFSGLRNSEFCGLTLRDAVLAAGSPALIVRGGKGEDRTVYIPSALARLTERWVAEVRPALLPDDVSPDDPSQALVFNERRRPYERTGLYRRVVRILTEAGLGDRASVQLLRHTYGYLAYARTGGNLLFVQRQLGHAHPMVTSIYAQFVDESYGAMANQLYEEHDAKEVVVVTQPHTPTEDDADDGRDPNRLL